MELSISKFKRSNSLHNIIFIMMGKTARDLILELYKDDRITKQEADTLLDAIDNKNNYYTQPTYQPYVDWTYRPYEQPRWTITSNTDTNNVE